MKVAIESITVGERRREGKAHIPGSLRWFIWERDNFTCHYCGRRFDLSIDHIVPESQGGSLELSNLITACRQCNSAKGTKEYGEVSREQAITMMSGTVIYGTDTNGKDQSVYKQESLFDVDDYTEVVRAHARLANHHVNMAVGYADRGYERYQVRIPLPLEEFHPPI